MASKSKKKSLISRAEKAAQGIIDDKVEEINESIKEIEAALRPYERLREKMDRLVRARDALLGGNRTTGAGGTRVRLDQVVAHVREHPGVATQAVADATGGTYHGAYAHLSRNSERFLTNGKGEWWLRDPKNGKNTIEDYEEEE